MLNRWVGDVLMDLGGREMKLKRKVLIVVVVGNGN